MVLLKQQSKVNVAFYFPVRPTLDGEIFLAIHRLSQPSAGRAKQSGRCRVHITQRYAPDCEPCVPPSDWLTGRLAIAQQRVSRRFRNRESGGEKIHFATAGRAIAIDE